MAGLSFDITGDNSNFLKRLEEVRNGVRSTSKQIEESGMSIEQMFGRLAKGAAAFGAGITAKEIVSNVVRIRGEFQQLEVAFNTMLGSKEKADALMQQLVKTAATTPFDLESVAGGAKQLLAYGVAADNVNGTLVRLGDIAAGLSIPLGDLVYLYGTTMSQGRLYTQDLNQFTGRGIPMIGELAKQFGVAESEVKKLVESGKVGFPEVQKVIESLTNEGGKFGGLMEAQSKTITGQISNIEDSISVMYNNIGKSSERFINDALTGVSYLVENYEQVGKAVLELATVYGAYKAILITITALQKVNSAVLAQATIEKNLCAIAGHKLSDAQAIAAARTKLLTMAQQGLTKAIKSVTAAMISNPYILIAAAVTGLGYAIYKVATAETELEKAHKRLSDANSDVEKSLASEVSKLTSLERKLSETKKGTEEYNKIKKTIVDNYAQYYKGLDGEIERVGNLSTVYGKLVEAMRLSIGQRKFESFFKAEQDNLDKTIGEKLDKAYDALIEKYGKDKGSKLYQQVFDYAVRGVSMSNDTWKELTKASFNFGLDNVTGLVLDINKATQASNKSLDEFKEKYQITEEEITKILSGSDSVGDKPVENKTLKQLLVDIDAAKTELKSLQDQANKGLISPDKVKEQSDTLSKLTSEYKLRTGKEYGSTKQENSSKKKQEAANELKVEQAEHQRKLEEYKNARINQEKQTEFGIRQAGINTKEEGFEKEKAQIDLNYDKLIEENRLRQEQWVKELQGNEKEQWLKDNPNYKKEGKVFTPTSTVADLSATQQKQLKDYTDSANEYQKTSNDKLLKDLFDEYQNYEQRRTAINKKYDAERKTIETGKTADGKDVSQELKDAAIIELEKKRKDAIKGVNDDEMASMQKTSDLLVRLFGDASNKSVSEINKIVSETEQLMVYLSQTKAEDITPKFGFTAEQLKTMQATPEQIKAMQKAMEELYDIGVKKDPFSALVKNIKNLFKTGAEEGEGKKSLEFKLSKIGESASAAADMVGDVAGNLSSMFEEMGNTGAADAMSGVQDAMNAISNIGQGFAKGGIIGGIAAAVGEAANFIGKAFAASARHQVALKEIMNETIAQQRAYNLLLLEQNLLYEKGTTIFGIDAYGKAANAIKVMKQAIADLNKELSGTAEQKKSQVGTGFVQKLFGSIKGANTALKQAYAGLADIEIKTGHEKTGLFGWGKGKDIYSSILSVDEYKELIDANGKLNIGMAETIINTKTMSDEDKSAFQHMIDLAKQAEEALKAVSDYLTDIFGDLGNTMSDALVDAFSNGTDAAQAFTDSVSNMLETLAKQMIYSVTLAPVIEKAQTQMMDVMKDTGLSNEDKFKQFTGVLDNLVGEAIDQQDYANRLYGEFQQMAKDKGFDILGSDSSDREASKKGFASMSQDSADELNGRFTVIQGHTYEINGSVKAIQSDTAKMAEKLSYLTNMDKTMSDMVRGNDVIISHLSNIEGYTANLVDIRQFMYSMKLGIDTLNTKGLTLKR